MEGHQRDRGQGPGQGQGKREGGREGGSAGPEGEQSRVTGTGGGEAWALE